MALFTKFSIPGLTLELNNPPNDWLDWSTRTNHQAGYLIHLLTAELKIYLIRALEEHG